MENLNDETPNFGSGSHLPEDEAIKWAIYKFALITIKNLGPVVRIKPIKLEHIHN